MKAASASDKAEQMDDNDEHTKEMRTIQPKTCNPLVLAILVNTLVSSPRLHIAGCGSQRQERCYIDIEVKDFDSQPVWKKKCLSVFSPPILPGDWKTSRA